MELEARVEVQPGKTEERAREADTNLQSEIKGDRMQGTPYPCTLPGELQSNSEITKCPPPPSVEGEARGRTREALEDTGGGQERGPGKSRDFQQKGGRSAQWPETDI